MRRRCRSAWNNKGTGRRLLFREREPSRDGRERGQEHLPGLQGIRIVFAHVPVHSRALSRGIHVQCFGLAALAASWNGRAAARPARRLVQHELRFSSVESEGPHPRRQGRSRRLSELPAHNRNANGAPALPKEFRARCCQPEKQALRRDDPPDARGLRNPHNERRFFEVRNQRGAEIQADGKSVSNRGRLVWRSVYARCRCNRRKSNCARAGREFPPG
ncbi:Uncharacterised protein [uncultured archaeon]|nr:Uncharacterised protein [uncultured archaeon]